MRRATARRTKLIDSACISRSCCSERWWPPGRISSRFGSPAAACSSSETRVGHLLVALRVKQQQRRAGVAQRGHRAADVERLEPGLGGSRSTSKPSSVSLRSPRSRQSSGRGADRHHGATRPSRAAAWIALEAAHARAAQRHRRGVSRSSSTWRACPRSRSGPKSPWERPWPRASKASAAMPWATRAREVEVALLGGARAVADDDAGARLLRRQEERVGKAVAGAELRSGAGGGAS